MQVRGGHVGQTELQAQVHDGNDLSAQVDDAFDVFGHPRNGGDVRHPDDLPDLHHGNSV
jgi:hypothetical protein